MKYNYFSPLNSDHETIKMDIKEINMADTEVSIRERNKAQLLEDLQKTKMELEIAYSGFDNAIEPDLIDCYIYKVNAVLKRYKYLMEKAAEYASKEDSESLTS